MHKISTAFLLVPFLLLASCKKDLLHYQSVQQLSSQTDSDRLNKILFIDQNLGFIVGGQRFYDAVILTTHDGGYTWQKQLFPAAGKELTDIVVAPSGAIYTCGFDGKLLRSYDMGQTWMFSQLEYVALSGLAFIDGQHARVVGGVSFSSGVIQHVDSNGNVTSHDSLATQFNKIVMVSGQTGYLCGYGVMLKTTDSAKTWQYLGVKGDNFEAMDVHGDEIWMCGYNGGVYHTTDGGNSWQTLRNGNDITLPRYNLYGILFKDENNGWAVGANGKVIHSDDGGQHWEEYDQFTTNTLYNIAACPNGDLLVAGDHGALYRIIPK